MNVFVRLEVDQATLQLVLTRLEPNYDGSIWLVDQYLAMPSRFYDGLIWLEPMGLFLKEKRHVQKT